MPAGGTDGGACTGNVEDGNVMYAELLCMVRLS